MFLLFMGDTYYPAGGADDLVGLYDTLGAALDAAQRQAAAETYAAPYAWAHVLDLKRRFVLFLAFDKTAAKVVREECLPQNA